MWLMVMVMASMAPAVIVAPVIPMVIPVGDGNNRHHDSDYGDGDNRGKNCIRTMGSKSKDIRRGDGDGPDRNSNNIVLPGD
jgi:hypothetical protein